jgi:hypothetical protein
MPTQATPIFAKGIGGKVTVFAAPTITGGVQTLGTTGEKEYAILDWNFTKTSTLVETTNSGSKGFEEYLPTKTGGAGSFNAIWDSVNIPDSSFTDNNGATIDYNFGPDKAGQLEVGALVTLKLTLGDSGKFYTFGARIESLAVTVNAVADVVKFACTFKSSGVITDPVQSA